jgi:hypothetical protein
MEITADYFELPRSVQTSKFADDQVVMADDENAIQRALYELYKNSLRKAFMRKQPIKNSSQKVM